VAIEHIDASNVAVNLIEETFVELIKKIFINEEFKKKYTIFINEENLNIINKIISQTPNIFNDIEENKQLKKHICNVSIGLLGKSINEACKSYVFDTPGEAFAYKTMCDAQYHTISKIEEVELNDVEEELPKEPIFLYYKNYDAMIEATTYFSNSTYFQTCEINNETVWKLAR
jgi:hypothetical protein